MDHRWPVTVHDAAAIVDGNVDGDAEFAVAEALVRTTAGVSTVHVAARPG